MENRAFSLSAGKNRASELTDVEFDSTSEENKVTFVHDDWTLDMSLDAETSELIFNVAINPYSWLAIGI